MYLELSPSDQEETDAYIQQKLKNIKSEVKLGWNEKLVLRSDLHLLYPYIHS